MYKRWIAWAVALALLLAGAALWYTRFAFPAEENVTRMAALGLMLLENEDGICVLAVRDGSEADRAGVLPGDVLLRADDTAVTDILQLENMLLLPRERMAIQLRRGQERMLTVWLKLR